MPDRDATIADALELIALNQNALGAAVEEISRWILERGSQNVHANVLSALQTIDINAEGIANAIKLLRR